MKAKLMSALLAVTLLGTLAACGSPKGNQSSTEGDTLFDDYPIITDESFNKTVTLAETVIVDEDGIKITATGLTYTNYSANLGIAIENNSGKDLSFDSGYFSYRCNSINGYMLEEGTLTCDVPNGKRANEMILFSYDSLMKYGIYEIADLEIGFEIRDDDDYNSIYIPPFQLKTSSFETYDYETNHYQENIVSQDAQSTYRYEMPYFSKDALYEQSGVKLLSSGLMSQDGEYTLMMEFENTTDSMVSVGMTDIGLNGLKLTDRNWAEKDIYPGKRGIVNLNLSDVLDQKLWGGYGIAEVNSISLSVTLCDEHSKEIAEDASIEITISNGNTSFDASGDEIYNSNGVRIVTKSIQEGGGDLFVLLLAENNSGKTLSVGVVYDSLSVNGVMTDYSCDSQELQNGESAALVIRLKESSLEANQIASASDVKEIEMGFEIEEGRTTIDETTLTLQFGA